MHQNKSAFTLIELVLVIALFVFIAAVTVPIAWSFVSQNDLDVSTTIAAQTMRRAQVLAASSVNDIGWGVEIESQDVVLFQGNNFATRNENSDEVFSLPESFNIGGQAEVDFQELSGQPIAPSDVTLSNGLNQSRTVSVNQAGMISY